MYETNVIKRFFEQRKRIEQIRNRIDMLTTSKMLNDKKYVDTKTIKRSLLILRKI